SASADSWRRCAIRSRLAVNGLPTPRWKRSLPRRRRLNGQARDTVPEALALLHSPQIRGDRRNRADHALHDLSAHLGNSAAMSQQPFPSRTHKIAIAVVALVTAVALMANYYLW